jgi:succinate dehydrogenase / fumarate reductase membrane anchor subunit
LEFALSNGTGHFVAQRVTAVALILLGLWFAASFGGLDSLEHAIVMAFIAKPLNGILLALLCAVLAYHSHLGVQVVIDDYVHAAGLNKASLITSRIAHLAVALVAVYAIQRIGSGA